MHVKKTTQQQKTRRTSAVPKRLLPSPRERTRELRSTLREDIQHSRQNSTRKLNSPNGTTRGKRATHGPNSGGRNGRFFRENPEVNWFGPNGRRTLSDRDADGSLIKYRNQEGRIEQVSTKMRSLSEYMQTNSKPLTIGTTIEGVRASEYHWNDRGVAGVLVKGRVFMGEIALNVLENRNEGDRMIPPIILNPRAIGGRLSYYADLYYNCRIIRTRLLYINTCSADTDGALMIQFRPDDASKHADVGIEAMIRAASSDQWIQVPVWQTGHLEIEPLDTMKQYFTEGSTNVRLTTQGCIEIMAASALVGSPSVQTNFGNIYLEYEMDFQRSTLAPRLTSLISGTCSFQGPTAPITSPYPVLVGIRSVPFPTGLALDFLPLLPADIVVGNYIFEFSVTQTSGWQSPAAPIFTSFPDESTQFMSEGQAFFGRFFLVTPTGPTEGFLFDNLDAAQNFVYDDTGGAANQPVSPGQLINWEAGTGAATVFGGRYRAWRMSQVQ